MIDNLVNFGDGGCADTCAAAQHHMNLPSARAWRVDEEGNYTPAAPGEFLPDPPFAASPPPTASVDCSVRIEISRDLPPENALPAIVVRGSNKFYLWQD